MNFQICERELSVININFEDSYFVVLRSVIILKVQPHLDPLRHASAVHTTRHVHRVPPDVVLRLPGPDHPGDHRPDVKT